MAEVKWIKLTTDMFDNAKIKFIRTLPEGNNIVLIWVMLLAKAGISNLNGYIFLTENIPYTQDMLAAEFGFEVNIINLALSSLEKLNMIQIHEQKISILNWEEYQNIEGLDKIREQTRKRVAKCREKQNQLTERQYCQYCGGDATGYDHIIATARGGKDTDDNKTYCCIECNRIKNDKPLVDFLNNNRSRLNDNIIANNTKLNRLVTLCNVTDRYIVTQGNATDIDKELDKDIDKDIEKKKETKKTNYDLIVDSYTTNQELKNTIYDFIKMRKSIKATLTDCALKLTLGRLGKLESTDAKKIEILEQSIMNSWKGIFELKEGNNGNGVRSTQQNTGQGKKFNLKPTETIELTEEERRRAATEII